MISTAQAADQLRITRNTPPGEPPVAVLARGLVDTEGNVLLDANDISAEGAELLRNGGDNIGTLSTVPDGKSFTVGENSQAIVYGTFTVIGTLTISGEMRFGAWPF